MINLSLSFPLGYLPSPARLDALAHAHDAGVVMVAAAGNAGAKELSWPAASRVVLAVGATDSTADATGYSNLSPALDLLAPGGDLARDANGDGWPDGIAAETVHPEDPSVLGYWFYQGTSQACAMVSGAAVHLLASGVDPADLPSALQLGSGGYSHRDAFNTGAGAAQLDLADSLDAPGSSLDVYVGLLPYVSQKEEEPRAHVVALDTLGEPLVGAGVMASVHAASGVEWVRCVTGSDGACTLGAYGLGGAGAWAIRVDAVVVDDVGHRPSRLLFASDAAEVLLQAIDDASDTTDVEERSLAVYWTEGYDAGLNADMAESWAVINSGTGLLSSPLGVVFLRRHVAGLSKESSVDLDVDGTGLLSSPLGFRVNLRTLDFDGTGLLSSPLGFRTMRLIGLDGSGLLSSPLGFHAKHLFAMSGTGLLSSPLGLKLTGQPIFLDRGTALGVSLNGTAYGQALAPGGAFTTGSGYDPAAWLVGTGLVDVGLALAPATSAPSGGVAPIAIAP